MKLNRRSFLKATLATAALTSLPMSLKAVNVKKHREVGRKTTQTWCEMCFWGCGVTVHSINGIVHKLEGQELCPNNYGSLCAKGNSGIYQLYDPDRLKKPLIRVGKRGEGKFKEVSWDEAISYVAEKLKKISYKYKPRSVSLIAHGSGEHAFITLMELIGSKNIAIPAYSQCMGSREIGWWLTYGKGFTGHEYSDGENSKCMMFLGRNVLESLQVGEAKKVIDGMSKGGKLIYVDPRYSKTAAKANYWLKIKPGTDLALLLGMINYIIENKLYDVDYVEKYCSGFSELKKSVKKYTLNWTEKETDIPVNQIVAICNELSKASPQCFIHPGRRLTRYGNDTQTVRAIGILNALMGNWNTPGGFYNVQNFPVKTHHVCEIEKEEKHKFQRADGASTKYKLAPGNLGRENGLFEAILTEKPYPIKAMIVYGTNFFQHYPDYNVCKRIVDKLDLLVTCEIYLTETALYSDVILPESTYLERQDPIVTQNDKYPFVQYREPATKPLFDTKGAWEISKLISDKMGFYKAKWKTIDETNEEFLLKAGISLEKLKEKGCYVLPVTENIYPLAEGEELEFETSSGQIELYSDFLENLGFDPIPKYSPIKDTPAGKFRLLFGRMSYHTHARTQNNRWLSALHNFEVKVWINKEKAKEAGIKDNDKVILVKGNKHSKPLTALLTEKIHPDAIFIPHGFGRFTEFMKLAFEMEGASDADFASNDVDPISGASAFQNAFVSIRKI